MVNDAWQLGLVMIMVNDGCIMIYIMIYNDNVCMMMVNEWTLSVMVNDGGW